MNKKEIKKWINENYGFIIYCTKKVKTSSIEYNEKISEAVIASYNTLQSVQLNTPHERKLSKVKYAIIRNVKRFYYKFQIGKGMMGYRQAKVISTLRQYDDPDVNDVKDVVSDNGQNNPISNKRARTLLSYAKGKAIIEDSKRQGVTKEDQNLLNDELSKLMNDTLNRRQRDIICRIFGFDCPEMSEKEIADMYDLSAQRINQIKKEALNNMKSEAKKRELDEYLCAQ
jgi:RNA polymerase sigma factor (sigma-70 family)